MRETPPHCQMLGSKSLYLYTSFVYLVEPSDFLFKRGIIKDRKDWRGEGKREI